MSAGAMVVRPQEDRRAVSCRQGSAPVASADQSPKRCRPETTGNEGTRDKDNSRFVARGYDSAPAASGGGAHELF